MDSNLPFFIIDDDKAIVMYLQNLISKIYPKALVLSASNGLEGWELIKKFGKAAIVISDVIMPEISGLQLLKNVRNEPSLNGVYFILITGQQEKEQNLKALQQGADDFLFKPFSVDALVARLRSAVRVAKLNAIIEEKDTEIKNLQDELELDFQKINDLVAKFQEIRIQGSSGILERVANAVFWIANSLGNIDPKQIKTIESAARLSFVGKLYLNDNLLKKPVMLKGRSANQTMEQVPGNVKAFLESLRGFEEIQKIVYHIYENFDGTGIPDKIKAWEIPLGSRLIRVPLDYEEMMQAPGQNQGKVMEYLYLEDKRLYDFKVVALFDQYLATKSDPRAGGKESTVLPKDLTDGMILARTIVTEAGIKIMGGGTLLTGEKIQKILSLIKSDPVIGSIYIKERR